MKYFLLLFLILIFVLVGCSTGSKDIIRTPTIFVTTTEFPTASSTITLSTTPTLENMKTQRAVRQATRQAGKTSTQTVRNLIATVLALTPSSTPTVTLEPTKVSTATPTQTIGPIQKTENEKSTQIAQFPTACDEMRFYYSKISPDGKWFAASCGEKRNQTLVVQNTEGTKWILEFADFLSPGFENDIMGTLVPLSWSPDDDYLYFSKVLGYSGGGNQCFSYSYGYYGLFRLNLNTGNWRTLVPPKDADFPGDSIEFSPSGDQYAISIDGIMLTNIITGEVTKIDVSGVMEEMIWSPDGKYLAYSVGNCGEDFVESSSIYVWDALTHQIQTLFTTDEMLLRPQSWLDNSTLRFEGEKFVGLKNLYTIYEYDITQDLVLFTGTATPRP
jgi:Tol biopolymer transport system component